MRFGSKADNLKRLQDAAYTVPPFYVVDGTDDLDIRQTKSDFEQWKTEHGITSAAVRSSSSLEDSFDQSFAGQFKTVLNVSDSIDFIAALKVVLSSRASASYAKNSGTVHAIVQQFIEPDLAGVIFSVNPATGAQEFVINAAKGRGSQVVDGGTAEQYTVDRLDRSRTLTTGAGLLSSQQVEELCEVCCHIEALFDSPQDIEWAFKDGRLYILQARPITKINHLLLWDSSNIAESFPGIVLPLTYSIAKHGYMLAYKSQAYAAGLSWYEIEERHRTFDAMIGIFNGRLYYNLQNWYAFISLFPGSGSNQQFLDEQIATQGAAAYRRPVRYRLSYRAKFYTRVLYRTIWFKRELNNFYARFERFEQDMRQMPPGSDTQSLMAQYSHVEQTIVPHFGRSVDNDFFVMVFHGRLKKLLRKWLPGQDFDQMNIIGSISGVLSSEQATSLYELAKKFKLDTRAAKLLQTSSFDELDKYIAENTLQVDIQAYIDCFGHRFAGDQIIEMQNPTLEPHGLYQLLQAYLQLDESEVDARLKATRNSSGAAEKVIAGKLNFWQRAVYRVLLNRLKHHLRIREKNRLIRGKVYGYMRELFPKVGQSLVRDQVLKSARDVFYLEIEEIFQLLQGALITNDLQDRVQRRTQAYKSFARIEMPERFITKNLPSLEKIEAVPVNDGRLGDSPHRDNSDGKKLISGIVSSPGTVEGIATVLHEPKIPDEPYDILIASHTDPGWTPLIALAKGVVVEHGGMLSHAAIVTRELGIPSLIGVQDVTRIVKTGMRVRINTHNSCLEILD